MEHDLPPGWLESTLGEILPIQYGKGLVESIRDGNGQVPVYGSSGVVGFHNAALTSKATLIIGRKGSVGSVYYSPHPCWPIDTTYFVEESDNLDLKFFLYLLTSLRLNQLDKSTAIPGLSRDDYNATNIKLAPLNEQHRIVAAIEQQFSRLDAAVTSLQHARAKLKRQRAAILKAAVEGTLTANWRAQHPTSETAQQLLQRILHERRAKWEAEQLAKMQARGVTPKDDKWKDAYKEPETPDTMHLPESPKGWMWARAEQLCEFITKGTTPVAEKLYRATGEIPFIKVYNLTDQGLLDFTVNPTFVSKQTHSRELARSKVFPGDVLMNIVGPPLGKVSIVPNLYPEWNINQAIAFFRPLTNYDRKLLCYSLLAEDILSWAKSRAKATAGQFNLTLEICRDLPLPLPPAEEQLQIVEEIELQLSEVDELEVTITANLKRAERLRQTILAEAFAGRLVPQSPEDEPACILLERIRREREERGGMRKKSKAGNGRARAGMRVSGEPVNIDVEGMEQVELWESVMKGNEI